MRSNRMSDFDPTDANAEEADQALAAAEQHQRADEDADPDEQVVIRDPETGAISEERAQ
jgi:hypothetical protein